MSPYKRLEGETRGQAMLETALMLPMLLALVFNTVNFGYFFLIALNVTAAPHSGALYSILGPSTPVENGGATLADPGPPDPTTQSTISGLTLGDLTGAVANASTTPVQVCTAKSGVNVATGLTVCSSWNSSPPYTPDQDPEWPSFVLNRVDVTYTFRPLIDYRVFNLVLLATPLCDKSSMTCTFHRQVSMRAMD